MFASDREYVLEKQKKRLKILRGIYRVTEGIAEDVVDVSHYPELIDIEGLDLRYILQYLEHEGLIRVRGSSLLDGSSPQIAMTHKGVVEIETAITRPTEPTEHFVEQVIQNYFLAPIGVVQTGSDNNADILQNND